VAYLGFQVTHALDPEGRCRLLVVGVAPGSPAARCGFRSGDTLFAVGVYRVESPDHLALALARYRPGAAVPVVAYRDGVILCRGDAARTPAGQPLVTLGDRPAEVPFDPAAGVDGPPPGPPPEAGLAPRLVQVLGKP
jgi:predicted metalloprotease with PDZ domain